MCFIDVHSISEGGGLTFVPADAGDEMVRAEDVVSIYRSLSANNIQVWLTGGWGIDALLGEQTRPHKLLAPRGPRIKYVIPSTVVKSTTQAQGRL